jgi:hypothetical protein
MCAWVGGGGYENIVLFLSNSHYNPVSLSLYCGQFSIKFYWRPTLWCENSDVCQFSAVDCPVKQYYDRAKNTDSNSVPTSFPVDASLLCNPG